MKGGTMMPELPGATGGEFPGPCYRFAPAVPPGAAAPAGAATLPGAGAPAAPGASRWRVLHGDLLLPVVVLRESALLHNARVMADYCRDSGVSLAPHAKTHMSPELAALQVDSGAWGLTVANAAQARVFHAFGFRRLLIANQVVDEQALRWMAAALRGDSELDVYCLVDSEAGTGIMDKALERRRHPPQGLLVDDLVGDEQPPEPERVEDPCLGGVRDSEPPGARIHLQGGQLRGHVCLRVRGEGHTAVAAVVRHDPRIVQQRAFPEHDDGEQQVPVQNPPPAGARRGGHRRRPGAGNGGGSGGRSGAGGHGWREAVAGARELPAGGPWQLWHHRPAFHARGSSAASRAAIARPIPGPLPVTVAAGPAKRPIGHTLRPAARPGRPVPVQ